MSKSEELLKLEQALATFDAKAYLVQTDEEDTDGGSDSGDGGGAEGGSVEVEKRLFIEVFSLHRQGEKEFGPTNEFDPIKYLNKDTRNLNGELGQGGLKSHPLLGDLARYAGETPDMSLPSDSPDAQKAYQNRLQLQLANRQRLKQDITPTPSRGM